jgi:hypothetical protein
MQDTGPFNAEVKYQSKLYLHCSIRHQVVILVLRHSDKFKVTSKFILLYNKTIALDYDDILLDSKARTCTRGPVVDERLFEVR